MNIIVCADEGICKRPRMMLWLLTLSRHESGTYTLDCLSVTVESMHSFTYMKYMFTLTVHAHAQHWCISATLASFTSLCTAPYGTSCSIPLHSMHTVSISLGDITVRSRDLQWLSWTKVYYLKSDRFKKRIRRRGRIPILSRGWCFPKWTRQAVANKSECLGWTMRKGGSIRQLTSSCVAAL